MSACYNTPKVLLPRQAATFIRGRRLARRRTPCKLSRAIAAAGDVTAMVLERCLDIVNSSDHMGGGDHMEKRHQCITWTRDTYTRIHAWTTRTYAPHGIETPMHHMDKRHLSHIAQRHLRITWAGATPAKHFGGRQVPGRARGSFHCEADASTNQSLCNCTLSMPMSPRTCHVRM